MQYQSTIFGQMLKELPRGWFMRTAARHATGRRKRELHPWSHVVSMVFAQLSGARGLREVERAMERQPGILVHLGLGRVRRSTLADANARRPSGLFEEVAGYLSGRLGRGRCGKEALRLIDATRIFAGKRVEHWSRGGVKLHVVFDPEQDRPTCFAVTPERVNDITAAKSMQIEPGATYVFDKGYYDFGFWARLHEQGCHFVTRLKVNSPTTLIRERKPKGEDILFDRVVRLSQRLAGRRSNPMSAPVRLIGVRIQTGREIVLLSNDLKASATQIADLYKTRWQVELFFKWMKQNLKLAHFFGNTRNAVTIQIMAALIAFLLLRIAQVRCQARLGLQAMARLMPAFLLARRPMHDLLKDPDPGPPLIVQPVQIELVYA